MSFGVAGFVLLCYFTEWRTVLKYVPYYRGKYSELEKTDALDKVQGLADDAERKENASRDFKQERVDKSNDIKKL